MPRRRYPLAELRSFDAIGDALALTVPALDALRALTRAVSALNDPTKGRQRRLCAAAEQIRAQLHLRGTDLVVAAMRLQDGDPGVDAVGGPFRAPLDPANLPLFAALNVHVWGVPGTVEEELARLTAQREARRA